MRRILALCLAGIISLSPLMNGEGSFRGNNERGGDRPYSILMKKKRKVSSNSNVVKKSYYINGQLAELETFTHKGTTMVLARDLVDPLGAILVVQPKMYNGKKVNVVGFGKEPYIVVYATHYTGKEAFFVKDWNLDNYQFVDAKQPPVLRNGRIYVPLRFTVQALGGTLAPANVAPAKPSTPSVQSPKKVVNEPKVVEPQPQPNPVSQNPPAPNPNPTGWPTPKKSTPPSPVEIKPFELPKAPTTSNRVDPSEAKVMQGNLSFNGRVNQVNYIPAGEDNLVRYSDFSKWGMFTTATKREGITLILVAEESTERITGFAYPMPLVFSAHLSDFDKPNPEQIVKENVVVAYTEPLEINGDYYVSLRSLSEGLGVQFTLN